MNFTSIIFIVLCTFLYVKPSAENDALHAISKRFVLFPRYSVVQITAGLSVPAIFPRRSINLSLGFQMNHDLPYNFSNFDPLYGRESFENIDFDRQTMYEYMVNVINAFGLDGETCLLRAICEVSEVPLHLNDANGEHLLEQILHFLLTPSKEYGTNKVINLDSTLEHKVLVAERLGRIHGECYKIFKCPISFLDLFTNKYY